MFLQVSPSAVDSHCMDDKREVAAMGKLLDLNDLLFVLSPQIASQQHRLEAVFHRLHLSIEHSKSTHHSQNVLQRPSKSDVLKKN